MNTNNFPTLLNETIHTLEGFSYEPTKLPDEFAHQQRKEKQGLLTLANHFGEVTNLGDFRGVLIQSSKINIVTMFFFPSACIELPVFAMEFVVLSQRPIIAVIDAKCLLDDMHNRATVKEILSQIHRSHPLIKQAQDMPNWYIECRSGDDFFIRPTLEELPQLSNIHLSVWQKIVDLFHKPRRLSAQQTQQHEIALKQYKEHHRINSPGLPLLKRSFGEQWTNSYLTQYLFQ